MNNDDHRRWLYAIEDALRDSKVDIPDAYWTGVVEYWLDEVAFVKNEEYGTECWERLGPKALVVDISACYYRWENLKKIDNNTFERQAMKNAIVDAFGYAMLYTECTLMKYNGDASQLSNSYQAEWGDWIDQTPKQVNEWTIRNIWNLQSPLFEEALVPVMVQPLNMWRLVS